jgi:hypothetical protein
VSTATHDASRQIYNSPETKETDNQQTTHHASRARTVLVQREIESGPARLDEPTGTILSRVASPQCRFRFARQNHGCAAAIGRANFRLSRDSGAIPKPHYIQMSAREATCDR